MILLVFLLGMDLMLGLDLGLAARSTACFALAILASVAIRAGSRSGTTYSSTGACFAYCVYGFRLAHSFRSQSHAHERHNQALDHYSKNMDLDRSKQFETLDPPSFSRRQ